MRSPVLLLPGLYNSGPEHWQSHWEHAFAEFTPVEQAEWNTPHADDWIAKLEEAVRDSGPSTVLAAHSLACTLVALWAGRTTLTIRGALLVAPSDTEAPSYPAGTTGFTPMPGARLPFPSIVVASTDDEYVSEPRAREFAGRWGSAFVSIGSAGHINSASRLGMWPEGLALLNQLRGA